MCWSRWPPRVFDINTLGDLTSVGTLVAFGLVCFSVIWLRVKRPDLPRHFKVSGYPVMPAHRRACCASCSPGSASKHAIRVWFVWFMLGDDRAVLRLRLLGEPDAQQGTPKRR